jgi:hypothetical protein
MTRRQNVVGTTGRLGSAALAATVLCVTVAGSHGWRARASAQADSGFDIRVLSSRPDLVSGGDALIQVRPPQAAAGAAVTALLNGRDVTAAFKPGRDPNTLVARLTGLPLGQSRLEVAGKDSRQASQLTLVNHPISGPVISGPHQTPFNCETQFTGLGAAIDTDCTAKTKIEYFYRSTAAPVAPATGAGATPDTPNQAAANRFRPYDPSAPRPADVDMTTTSDGRTVPYIVRREMGTINRAIYVIALLHDPATPRPDPWTGPNGGWNGKLIYSYGGGCRAGYHQGRAIGGLSPNASFLEEQQVGFGDDFLAKGYAIAAASLNVFGTNCADLISAETTMMVKEHFIEEYGVPQYTIGTGGSGGSMQQHMIANNYPGLLDGIIPGRSYADIIEFFSPLFDCELLLHAFGTSPLSWTEAQKTAVAGHKDINYCTLRATGYPNLRAKNCDPANVPASQVYDPVTNPKGARCTYQDNMVNVFGRDPRTGFARRPFDNVGVQYGLKALNDGVIGLDQFLDLNRRVGGHDIDGNLVPARTVGDVDALRVVYQTGRINEGGAGLATLPIIDLRSYVDGTGDVHDSVHSDVMRARLKAANGTSDNQVVVTVASLGTLQKDLAAVDGPLRTVTRRMLDEMDAWLAAIAADRKPAKTSLERVVRNRPARLVDGCYTDKLEPVTDRARCAELFPYAANPRLVAGEPLTTDRLKCELKAVDRRDYRPTLTDNQLADLRAVFPQGVCDYSKKGVGQGPSQTWLSFPFGGQSTARNEREPGSR